MILMAHQNADLQGPSSKFRSSAGGVAAPERWDDAPLVSTRFTKLNERWNAEPNAPDPQATVVGGDVHLDFRLNEFQFPELARFKGGRLIFKNATRFRMGRVNDEGWYRGQCRFSKLAPAWGEYYEVQGDLVPDRPPDDWHAVGGSVCESPRHFLFYFRDEEFECDAEDWEVQFIEHE
jgi:hypothetical protein